MLSNSLAAKLIAIKRVISNSGKQTLAELAVRPVHPLYDSLMKALDAANKCADLDDELAACNIVRGLVYLGCVQQNDAVREGKLAAVKRSPSLLPVNQQINSDHHFRHQCRHVAFYDVDLETDG